MEKQEALNRLSGYLPYDVRVTFVNKLFGGEKIEYHHNQTIDRLFMDYGNVSLHTEPYSKQSSINNYLFIRITTSIRPHKRNRA